MEKLKLLINKNNYMSNIKYHRKIEKYSIPRKTLFALTFGYVRSSRRVGRATARYVLNLV